MHALDPAAILARVAAWATASDDRLLSLYLDLTRWPDTLHWLHRTVSDAQDVALAAQEAADQGFATLVWFEDLRAGHQWSAKLSLTLARLAQLGPRLELDPLLLALESSPQWLCIDLHSAAHARVWRVQAGVVGQPLSLGASVRWTLPQSLLRHIREHLQEHPNTVLCLFGPQARLEAFESHLSVGLLDRIEGRTHCSFQHTAQAWVLSPDARLVSLGDDAAEGRWPLAVILKHRRNTSRVALSVAAMATAHRQGRDMAVVHAHQALEGQGWSCPVCSSWGVAPLPPVCVACGAEVEALGAVALLEVLAERGLFELTLHASHTALEELGGFAGLFFHAGTR